MMIASAVKIFSGNASPDLSARICKRIGKPLCKADVKKFANGETHVIIHESIRNDDVFIIQPTCTPNPNDFLMELLIMVDAMKRGSAARITAVIPHFGYARQDKKDKSRAPITGKLVAKLLEESGVDRVITLDLHASQIQGFFDIPVDNLYAEPLFIQYVKSNIKVTSEIIIVSPDAGGVKRAKAMADKLDCALAIIHKERKKANEVAEMTLVGDVEGKVAILVDDMADTCGTLVMAANTLQARGAKDVYALITHPVFSGPAVDRLNSCSSLKEVIVTNSIPHKEKKAKCDKIKTIDISPLFAEVIRRTHNGESISVMFEAVW